VVPTVKLPESLLKSFYVIHIAAGAAPTARLGGQRAHAVVRGIGEYFADLSLQMLFIYVLKQDNHF
jgi:hypothetical protein